MITHSSNLFTILSELVHLWTVFEHSGEVPEVPAGELHVPGGEAVADVWGVQGVRLLPFHLPEMKSLLDGYSWPLLVLLYAHSNIKKKFFSVNVFAKVQNFL